MYEVHFGLSEKPFSIAPDPEYLYMSRQHREAMAHLSYGIEKGGGFILLTGEVGTGKTTLCRNLLKNLPDNVNISLILNAAMQKDELLPTICDELKIKYRKNASQKTLLIKLNQYLFDSYSKKRKTVLIIDEAQLLSRDVLEQVRILTNLETTKDKLLQIILIGQPELNDTLKRQDLRQLAQRVTARYHLNSLKQKDITDYVMTRLKIAGCVKPIFTKQALIKIYHLTQGIPRLINVLCDHSLIAAYSKDSRLVDVKAVKKGAKDMMLDDESNQSYMPLIPRKVVGICASLLLATAIWYGFSQSNNKAMVLRVQSVIHSITAVTTKKETGFNKEDQPITVAAVNENDTVSSHEILKATPDDTINFNSASNTQEESFIVEKAATTDLESINFDQLLSSEQANTTHIHAFRNLSLLWEMSLPSIMIDDLCSEVRKLKLDCYTGEGSLNELALYNRPAILFLENSTGSHRVILRGINDAEVLLQLGQSQVTATRSELEKLWNGKYLFFWQPPAVDYRLFQEGNSGTQIVWLRQQINFALLKNKKSGLDDTASSLYDTNLSQVVRDIQADAGIVVDGQVGLQTYMIINQMLGTRVIPKLESMSSELSSKIKTNLNAHLTDSENDSTRQKLGNKAL